MKHPKWKKIVDRVLSMSLLIALLPVLLVIGILIRLYDRGPVLFVQRRVGQHGRTFNIFKFRTMVINADQFLDATGRVTAQNRVTPIGRWLRKTSLDELPQLLNIVRGEMSLIGPRPILEAHFDRLTPWQRRRVEMRPGVTGLAQVSGRNTLKWSRRIELDIEYIEGFSLWLDMKILMRTLQMVWTQEGVVLDRNCADIDDLPPARQDLAA